MGVEPPPQWHGGISGYWLGNDFNDPLQPPHFYWDGDTFQNLFHENGTWLDDLERYHSTRTPWWSKTTNIIVKTHSPDTAIDQTGIPLAITNFANVIIHDAAREHHRGKPIHNRPKANAMFRRVSEQASYYGGWPYSPAGDWGDYGWTSDGVSHMWERAYLEPEASWAEAFGASVASENDIIDLGGLVTAP